MLYETTAQSSKLILDGCYTCRRIKKSRIKINYPQYCFSIRKINDFISHAANDLGEALKHSHCKLESLDLGSNNLTDDGAKDLADALKHSNCKLKSLDLGFTNFTKETEQYLTDAGRQRNCDVSECLC